MSHETDDIAITYDNSSNGKISCLIAAYFKIEGIAQEKIAEIIKLEKSDPLSIFELSDFLYGKDDDDSAKADTNAIKTIISPLINNWCYIRWTYAWYDECKNLVEKLSTVSNYRISCFMIDPWMAHYFWIVADEGKVIRAFELTDTIHVNIGLPLCAEEEAFIQKFIDSEKLSVDEWVKNRENPFLSAERVYRPLIKYTGQHIEILNDHMDDSKSYISGTVTIGTAE
jgi:hypothetical protein